MRALRTTLTTLLCLAALAGCSDAEPAATSNPMSDAGRQQPSGPSAVSAAEAQLFEQLQSQAQVAGALDAQGALAAYPTSFRSELSYDPSTAVGLDTIQGSALALTGDEVAKLGQQGFVISRRREFPTFLRGYAEIYSEHLPLYVSADSLLESIHSSYDTILLNIEREILLPDLQALLAGMHARLADSDATASTKADADVYLAVASSLLSGAAPVLRAGGDAANANALVGSALAANGIQTVTLFGVKRMEDFSQFTPRGHYTGDEQLERYFRAMMWLGRVDLRIIETLSDGKEMFRPDQYQAMLLLASLIAPDRERWQRIDDAVRTFVGESDYMVVPDVDQLVADLGGVSAAKNADEEAVVAAIAAGGYGKQQIASHLMVNDGTVPRLPLNRSFLVFGQRYIVDSHVFSEVVYDRIERLMPNPLDAAFSALGNNHALALSMDELAAVPALPGALSRMRVLIDAHDDGFWQANFYNLWLSALRALSPADDLANASTRGLPEVAATEAWGRRILNTQLGSWAELRHDTLLYAKQSYTGIPACEFPDAYVDPYPELFRAIVAYAEQGSRIVDIAQHAPGDWLGTQVAAYFDSLRTVASTLAEMAEAQTRGEAFTAEQLAFINDAVRVDRDSAGCTTIEVPNGWYAKLFFQPEKSIEFDPTIADVHTQPAAWGGAIVGRVLHVGTGYPRYFVTTIDTCNGPRAYAGVVFAYHEETTSDFERLTDEKWAERFQAGAKRPSDVAWMQSVLTP